MTLILQNLKNKKNQLLPSSLHIQVTRKSDQDAASSALAESKQGLDKLMKSGGIVGLMTAATGTSIPGNELQDLSKTLISIANKLNKLGNIIDKAAEVSISE